jgi:HD-GYP domain-containing protein (c-di-GMP phosphodiesterase class II)
MNRQIWIDHLLAPRLRDDLQRYCEVCEITTWATAIAPGGPTVVIMALNANIGDSQVLFRNPAVRIIGLLPTDNASLHPLEVMAGEYYAILSGDVPQEYLHQTISAAFSNLEAAERAGHERDGSLERDREELNRIGIALSSTRNLDDLLELILSKTREMTSADAGSLYIVEASGSENGLSGRGERVLRFKLIQNDSRSFPFVEESLPLNEESMAGNAALHGEVIVLDDVYRIPDRLPYRFNSQFDEETGYRTRSLLTVPMKNAQSAVIGVMQLVNCKRHWSSRLTRIADIEREVLPFSNGATRIAESLASQAAVAYENSRLYREVEVLFEGFVQAAVTAIEQRDPTTSGHSIRVATMSVAFADALNLEKSGPFADTKFTADQIKELRYAALLHDFGKIAVREEVLVKAKKLYPAQLTILRQRFEYLRQQLETQCVQKKLDMLMASKHDPIAFGLIETEFRNKELELDEMLQFVLNLNDGSMPGPKDIHQLMGIARKNYRRADGRNEPLLSPGEVSSLSIPHGSLNEEERLEIESHVAHSFNFLVQIPWTTELKYIPWIVRAHHEKSNGGGYPYHLRGEEIPLQARMMAICDMFDALYAADRPYKKAVSVERALEILDASVQRQEFDAELFRIFVDRRIFECCVNDGNLSTQPQIQVSLYDFTT